MSRPASWWCGSRGPATRTAVFSIAETALIGDRAEHGAVLSWPLSNPNCCVEGMVREISPVADPTTRTYTVKVTLKDPPPQVRFGMSIGGRWKGSPVPVVALPLSALVRKERRASRLGVRSGLGQCRAEAGHGRALRGRYRDHRRRASRVATSSLPPASICCARTRRCVLRRRPRW